jgi:hypothetical protein
MAAPRAGYWAVRTVACSVEQTVAMKAASTVETSVERKVGAKVEH